MPNNKIKPLQLAVTEINSRGFNMAEFSENRVVNNSEGFLIANAIREGRRRRLNVKMALNHLVARRTGAEYWKLLLLFFCISSQRNITPLPRSCRRLTRNTGWWENAWNNYSEASFKKTFRISRSTFRWILNRIGLFLAREILTEDPVSPELRLALCLRYID